MVFFYPVSERGQQGVDELHSQTTKLLTFQSMPQEVFDAPVAFNMLPRWGALSSLRLADARAALDREVRGYLDGRCRVPAITLVQAPLFFGQAFSAYAEFPAPLDAKAAAERLKHAGFSIYEGEDPEPSNVTIAGSAQPVIRPAERDPGVENGYWFWGAADNMRLASANAVGIAEKLIAC
jgi:aspartate-semialdehyde dehydrogenase